MSENRTFYNRTTFQKSENRTSGFRIVTVQWNAEIRTSDNQPTPKSERSIVWIDQFGFRSFGSFWSFVFQTATKLGHYIYICIYKFFLWPSLYIKWSSLVAVWNQNIQTSNRLAFGQKFVSENQTKRSVFRRFSRSNQIWYWTDGQRPRTERVRISAFHCTHYCINKFENWLGKNFC